MNYRDSGDEEYISLLVERINTWLFRTLYRLTGDKAAAKDILQDSWLNIIRLKYDFKPSKGNFKSYIYKIAMNELYHWSSKKKFEIQLNNRADPIAEDPVLENEFEELSSILRSSLMKLRNKNYRDALVLHYFAGLKITEISDMMHSSEQNVKNWLHRGRLKVETDLRKHPDFETILESINKLITYLLIIVGS